MTRYHIAVLILGEIVLSGILKDDLSDVKGIIFALIRIEFAKGYLYVLNPVINKARWNDDKDRSELSRKVICIVLLHVGTWDTEFMPCRIFGIRYLLSFLAR